jgi:nucleotide-binding universal stress UspA family protein
MSKPIALAFIDFSYETVALANIASLCAESFHMQLILMHISAPDADSEGRNMRSDVSRRGIASEMRGYHRRLNILAADCAERGVPAKALLVRSRSMRGSPAQKMVRELRRLKPSLIIMGTHQHGRLFDAIVGSASARIVRYTPCPILLVPTGNCSAAWPFQRSTRQNSIA